MKIYIINEPFVKDFCRTQRWAARTRGRVLRPPDWLAYTAAVLEKQGYDARLFDFPAEDWEKDKLRDLVRSDQPDIVVLDATTPSIYSDIECAKIVKDAAGSTVIMVGPHVSSLPEETLINAAGAVDVICRGEYEYTVLDIVRCLENSHELSDVQGISYMVNGEVKNTPDRALIADLDELPFPAWRHLNIMKYFDGTRLYPYLDIISGRGCPFKCSFCLWPQVMHGRRYRLRSPVNVVDEMQYDIEHWPALKKGELFFEDDTFTVNKKRAVEICDEILRRRLKITWSVNARADIYDADLFKKMKQAGCRMLLAGFESGDQQLLDNMNKKLRLDQSVDFVKLAHQAGLAVHGCFVLGFPGETKESINRTIDFAMKLDIDSVQFSAAIPFPGTDYYQYCKEKGLIKARSWADWLDDGEQSTVMEYPGLSKQDIVGSVDKALRKFYLRPTYMIKFLLSTRSVSDLYRKMRGFRNFLSYYFTK
jgi:radical SAM superfamily enzyme YgiQ (UPF0313 family)